MAGQIGFLPDTFSNDPRMNTERGASIPEGSGAEFRQNLIELNAEWQAESALAQPSGNADSDSITLNSGLAFTDQVLPNELAANSTVVSFSAELSANAGTNPLPTAQLTEAAAVNFAEPIDDGVGLTGDPIEYAPIDPRVKGTVPIEGAVIFGDEASVNQKQDTLVSTPELSREIIETHSEIQIRPQSQGDADVPNAPSQPRSERPLSQAQVPAFTPFQQNAAAVLPDQGDRLPNQPANAALPPSIDTPQVARSADLTAPLAPAEPTVPSNPAPDTPLAPPQTGTTELASNVPVSADTPLLQQNDAAVLPDQSDADVRSNTPADPASPRASELNLANGSKQSADAIIRSAVFRRGSG